MSYIPANEADRQSGVGGTVGALLVAIAPWLIWLLVCVPADSLLAVVTLSCWAARTVVQSHQAYWLLAGMRATLVAAGCSLALLLTHWLLALKLLAGAVCFAVSWLAVLDLRDGPDTRRADGHSAWREKCAA